jgi:hypothetical protein
VVLKVRVAWDVSDIEWKVATDCQKDHITFIFKFFQSKTTTVLRNVGNSLPVDTP